MVALFKTGQSAPLLRLAMIGPLKLSSKYAHNRRADVIGV
jgi:hypothetical protein